MLLKFSEIINLSIKVLEKHGYSNNEAIAITKMLFWAEKRGSSQGFNKLFGWKIAKEKDAKSPTIEKTTANMLLINAQKNNQIIAFNLAINELLKKMETEYSVTVGIKNAINSAGAIGYYNEKIAKAGYIGIIMSAADPGVAPYGGSQPVFGTNPISIAIPTDKNPIILDMSIANLTWGDLIKAKDSNTMLPENSAFDEDGNSTRDPENAMNGCVKTFDNSYKGSGLALMIQILAGPLVGSAFSTDYKNCQYGSLIITINPAFFGGKEAFTKNIINMIEEIKNTKTAEGFDEITIPSEIGYRNSTIAIEKNEIEISEELLTKIKGFLL
jgi:LDH2 family malate/lactate/ureidoglycolate dehydrogenase